MTSHQSIPRYDYTLEDLQWVPGFINEVRDFFFARPQDNLLILRPNKTMHLNETGMRMLKMLLDEVSLEDIIKHFVDAGGARQIVMNDLAAFVDDLRSMTIGNQNIYSYKTAKIVPFGEGEIKYPVLSEIALTYRCNNNNAIANTEGLETGFVIVGLIPLLVDNLMPGKHTKTARPVCGGYEDGINNTLFNACSCFLRTTLPGTVAFE